MMFRRGQVYFAHMGHCGDHAQKGDRPCVIVSNNMGNLHGETVVVVPLTGVIKKTTLPSHCIVSVQGCENVALCEQIRTLSKEMLDTRRLVCTLTKDEMTEIGQAIRSELDL